MSTILLDRSAIRSLINMSEVINVVEEAFKAWAEGKANMPPKAYLTVERGDFRAMPAALPGFAGVKWVNSHPFNRSHSLPAVMAVLICNDPETGFPLAVMDGTEITYCRTGAIAAIASKYLARRNSNTLGIVGAGCQAYTQIIAHAELFELTSINAFDIATENMDKLISSLPEYPIRKCSLEEAVSSDIVCTLTPSREPIIKRRWVADGTHINAVGADGAGKEELEPSILRDAMVVVDEVVQASHGGEINMPISKGLFTVDEIYATLAEVLTGKKKGRTDSKAITVFDSTGVAIQDLAVAKLIFGKAQERGGYPVLGLV
ncbi:MAG: ornithine cyclodeaminase family protein [Dehalococcoidales bacterium]|nr:ornithine cyclodeaminase family protein [Dehalococcoidales bacterium]